MMDLIDNADRLTTIFGEWPSFHDAEVVRLDLDRCGEKGATLEARFRVFRMTAEVAPTGHFVLEKHTLVTLTFTGVASVEIEGFNEQNVLFDLDVSPQDPGQHEGRRLAVLFVSSFGVRASFECVRGAVTDVRPYDPSS